MENFVYYTPTKVYFGKDEELKIGKILKDYNPHKVLIHFGSDRIKKSGFLDKIESLIKDEGIKYVELGGVKANPEVDLVYEGIKLARAEGVDFILAIGGGSVLDSAKSIANGLANPEDDTWDYNLGKKKPQKTTRKGAILTISAAGSEMSESCVINNPHIKEKRGYNSVCNRFDFAIENPELTYTVSKYQTACGAVDIAMHTIERYFCIGGFDITDSIALEVIKNAFKYGKIAYDNPMDYEARANLMWTSSLAHNGLTTCGHKMVLAVHQFEHELSAFDSNIAHGAGLAAVWCSWARYVYKYQIDRFYNYAHIVWGVTSTNKEEAILTAIKMQEDYYKSIGMPISLVELGIKESDLEYLAIRCSRDKTRAIGGVKELVYDDILAIYKMAFPKR